MSELDILRQHLISYYIPIVDKLPESWRCFYYQTGDRITYDQYITRDKTYNIMGINHIFVVYDDLFVLVCYKDLTITGFINGKQYDPKTSYTNNKLQHIVLEILQKLTLDQQEEMYRSMLKPNNTKNAWKV